MFHKASRIALVGLASIILACGGDAITPTAPDIDGLGGALATEKKPGKGKPGKIPLIVTFDDGGIYGVKSDGLGTLISPSTYVDGDGGLEAWIMSGGNFHLSVKTAITDRELCFDFPEAAVGNPFEDEGGSGCHGGYINSGDPDVAGGLPAMAVDPQEPATMTSRLTVNWSGIWSLPYGYDCDGGFQGLNRAKITRIDENTWTIEGTNTFLCKAPTGKGKNKEPGRQVWEGAMPFFLTASVKNPQ